MTTQTKEKYRKNFIHLIKSLEMNCVRVCDPSVDQSESRFRKCHYKVDSKVFEDRQTWDTVLEKISLQNIHVYSVSKDNKLLNPTDPRSDMAE